MESNSQSDLNMRDATADPYLVSFSARYGARMISPKNTGLRYTPNSENLPFVLYKVSDSEETAPVPNVQEAAPWSKGKKALYLRADTAPEVIQELRAKGYIAYPKRIM